MGVFVLHSAELGDTTFSMMEDSAEDYQLVPTSLDMAYEKRLEMIYAESVGGGRATGVKTGLVPIKFQAMVKGTSMANAMLNLAALTRRITHHSGGYLEYRPAGLGDTIMSTWYRFVASPVPKQLVNEALVGVKVGRYEQDGAVSAIEVEVTLLTYAWGISDPRAPVAIASESTVDNAYDTSPGRDNTLSVTSASIKGEGFLPLLTIKGNNASGVTAIERLYIHKHEFAVGDGDHLDWREAETFSSSPWTDNADTDCSGNSNTSILYTQDADIVVDWSGDTPDEALAGAVAPIVLAWVNDIDELYRLTLSSALTASSQGIQETAEIAVDGSDDGTLRKAREFPNLNLPPHVIPDWVGEAGMPTFSAFFGGTMTLDPQTQYNDRGHLYIDFFWFPNVSGNNYLVRLDGGATILNDQSRYLIVDCLTGVALASNSSDEVQDLWVAHGPPLTDFIIRKGKDTQLRLLGIGTGGYDSNWEFRVTVEGFWVTIWPFRET